MPLTCIETCLSDQSVHSRDFDEWTGVEQLINSFKDERVIWPLFPYLHSNQFTRLKIRQIETEIRIIKNRIEWDDDPYILLTLKNLSYLERFEHK